jgi:hypothetical protein
MYFIDHINIATTTSDIDNILSAFEVLIKIKASIDVEYAQQCGTSLVPSHC